MCKLISILQTILFILLAPLAAEGGEETVAVRLEGWMTDYSQRSGVYGSTSRNASASINVQFGQEGYLYLARGGFDSDDAGFAAGGSTVGSINVPTPKSKQDLIDQYPFVWWVKVIPHRTEIGKHELEVEWERIESQVRGKPVRTAGDSRRIVMREDETHVLDFERLPLGKETEETRDLVLKLSAEVREAPELAHELLRYRLWHRHRDGGREIETRKILMLGKQGERVDFRFAPLRFDPEKTAQGDPALVDFVVEVMGAVQGRVQKDGTIEVKLGATRFVDTVLNGDPRSGGVGGGGVKVFTMSSGESVRLELPVPEGSSWVVVPSGESGSVSNRRLEAPDDGSIGVNHRDFYVNHDDAIILTVTREE